MLKHEKSITELARELRNNMTPSEKKVWEILKERHCLGFRFNRQKPIVLRQVGYNREFIIADFYCGELKLIIEVDGGIHYNQQLQDQNRDLICKLNGITVLRIKNEELVNQSEVERKIIKQIRELK